MNCVVQRPSKGFYGASGGVGSGVGGGGASLGGGKQSQRRCTSSTSGQCASPSHGAAFAPLMAPPLHQQPHEPSSNGTPVPTTTPLHGAALSQ